MSLIGERYQIGEKIGQGGMGTVFIGEDLRTQTPIAVKLLRDDRIQNDPELLERFRREGEALRDLNHPNIVKMLDAVQQDTQHYLVLEYVTGGDLLGLLKQGQLTIKRVLELALDIADALTRAHKLHIIHRDLKPANVLIANDGSPRLTDFGVAYLADRDRVTDKPNIIGTLDYLAPEALRGGLPNEQTDIWAFGVLLFEMLTNERPFKGEMVGQVVTNILTEAIPDIESLRDDVPAGLVDLIYRMLEKDVALRVNSVRVIGTELEYLLRGSSAGHLDWQSLMVESTPTPAAIIPHNLPAQTTSFIGREEELGNVCSLLCDNQARLVTILAPGGMGKTRLALEAAHKSLEHFQHGVFFTALAPLDSAAAIPPAIADALGYQFQRDNRSPTQQLYEYLRAKNLLLILDNFEHVIDGADVVAAILNEAPQVKILVTSRQRLNQSGEVLVRIEPFAVDDWQTIEHAAAEPAVQLFLQGAQRLKLDYELTIENIPHISAICRAVEGLPLGILIASSWITMLRVDEIASEINQSLDILETELKDIPERQRSIRAVYEYSWRLMSVDEQVIFSKLAVFRGGFTREAAQAVTGANLRTLMRLMHQSLLTRDVENGRYNMHQLLRQYAEEKLVDADAARAAHAQYYVTFLQEQTQSIMGGNQLQGLNTIEADFENIHAAWRFGVTQAERSIIDGMIDGVYWYCHSRGRLQHGAMLFVKARDVWRDVRESRLAARLAVRFQLSGAPMQWIFRQAIKLASEGGDMQELAFCLHQSGRVSSHYRTNTYGIEQIERSINYYQELKMPFYEALARDDLAWAYGLQGDGVQYLEHIERSLEIRREISDLMGVGNALRSLATVRWGHGKWDEAIAMLREARAISKQLGDRFGLGWTTIVLGGRLLMRGSDDTEAYELLLEGQALANNLRVPTLMDKAQAHISFYHCLQGDYEAARHELKQLLAGRLPKLLDPALMPIVAVGLGLCHLALNDYAKAVKLMRDVLPMYNNLIAGLGVCFGTQWLPHHALIMARRGENETAAKLLGLIYEHPQADTVWVREWQPIIALRNSLRETLGADEYEQHYQRGAQLDIGQVVKTMLQSY